MPNPNTAHEVRCNHPWELRFMLVGTNKVQTLGYKSVPGPFPTEIQPFQNGNTIATVLHLLIENRKYHSNHMIFGHV